MIYKELIFSSLSNLVLNIVIIFFLPLWHHHILQAGIIHFVIHYQQKWVRIEQNESEMLLPR